MCLWNNSFQSKMKPKYFHKFLGHKIGLPRSDKSRGGGLKAPWFLLKWKTSVLEYLIMSPKLSKRLERMLYPQNKCELEDRKDLSWTIKSSSSTKEKMEIGILRFLNLFSKMYRSGEIYNMDKMGESVDPWPTPTLISKEGDERLFHKYFVLLWIR